MSRAGAPRWRYVAFRLHAARPLDRRFVQHLVARAAHGAGLAGDDAPTLTRYDWPHGIVRVRHVHADAARRLLSGLTTGPDGRGQEAVHAEPLSTSGTLKALTDRLGVLQERGAPRPDRAGPHGAPRRTPPPMRRR